MVHTFVRNLTVTGFFALSGLAFSAQANLITNGSFDDIGFTAG